MFLEIVHLIQWVLEAGVINCDEERTWNVCIHYTERSCCVLYCFSLAACVIVIDCLPLLDSLWLGHAYTWSCRSFPPKGCFSFQYILHPLSSLHLEMFPPPPSLRIQYLIFSYSSFLSPHCWRIKMAYLTHVLYQVAWHLNATSTHMTNRFAAR